MLIPEFNPMLCKLCGKGDLTVAGYQIVYLNYTVEDNGMLITKDSDGISYKFDGVYCSVCGDVSSHYVFYYPTTDTLPIPRVVPAVE